MLLSLLVSNSRFSGFFPQWRQVLVVILISFSGLCLGVTHHAGIRPIIDCATLKQHLLHSDPNLLLVDVRESDAYQHEHLPGAINLPVEQTFNQHGDRTRIASLEQFRELLSQGGVKNTDYVVLYDDGTFRDAAHIFWVMETYGHNKLSVLDGGIAAWVAQHGEVSSNVTPRPVTKYVPHITTHRLSTELSTLLAIKSPNVAIIDARNRNEYLGIRSKAKRKGHIPSAISIPWSENLQSDGQSLKVKPTPALQSLYGDLDKKEHLITYCNRGKESAVTYLVLRSLGYNVSVYDGAWLEWGNDMQLPIEIGPTAAESAPHAR